MNDGFGSSDCNGHGTHVAGTVGGKTYGVAKSVKLFAVRVLNCAGSGSNSGVIAGVDYVTYNHKKPAVANMSLGGGTSRALDDAVSKSIRAGVTYAVSPPETKIKTLVTTLQLGVGSALTVGASTKDDSRASFSNYGSCVDLFAPGKVHHFRLVYHGKILPTPSAGPRWRPPMSPGQLHSTYSVIHGPAPKQWLIESRETLPGARWATPTAHPTVFSSRVAGNLNPFG